MSETGPDTDVKSERDLTAVIIPAGQLSVEEVHRIVLDSGRHGAINTRSPSLDSPFSSCANNLVVRRMNLP